jgi:hypothetical protein
MTYLSISAFVEIRHQKEHGSDGGSNMAMGMATAAQALLFHSINGTQSPQNTMFLHECDCPTARHDTLLPSCWLLRDIRTWKQDPGNDPACVLGNHVVGPFCISVLVIPVVTGCQQSGYLASRINVSTTGWSGNHGPSRGEPWEPAAEQPGSFLGSVLAHVGECWRVLASVCECFISRTRRPGSR